VSIDPVTMKIISVISAITAGRETQQKLFRRENTH